MIKIIAVDSKKLLKSFIMLPFELYKNDPNWVAPLIMDQYNFFNPQKNPYYEHSEVQLYLAMEDGKVLGRISAHTNTQHQKEHNEDIGFFGFFDSVDRVDVAKALFKAAGDWNKKRGFASMRGPTNFSVNQEIGLLIDGFDTPPMVMMRHDHPYYQKLYEACGLEKAMDLYAYLSERTEMPERIERLAAAIEKRSGVTIRSLSKNKKELQKDIETVFEIYTKAWEYNWGNVPMTKAEFDHIVAELLPLADPDLIFIAEKDGHPAGFSLALPNYNEVLKVMNGHVNPITMIKALLAKRKIHSARVITMGIIKEYQGRGIDTLLYYYAYKNGLPKGIFRGEFSWVLENNTMMIRVAQMLDAIPYKTYRLYDKSI
ncbi:MAG: GNAT family N-acetyltransferase [Candidatus Cloacimonetes bacterium]|jgi:GNAT superfamily N-acetyltransferase|nr:GNAT family N-acetyltransferase [Candidatus Cloacimonadota bacterium]MDY0172505.1 GNAT family N-acetyltransferase [Candidatus Cloacimonadaceae bacterium]